MLANSLQICKDHPSTGSRGNKARLQRPYSCVRCPLHSSVPYNIFHPICAQLLGEIGCASIHNPVVLSHQVLFLGESVPFSLVLATDPLFGPCCIKFLFFLAIAPNDLAQQGYGLINRQEKLAKIDTYRCVQFSCLNGPGLSELTVHQAQGSWFCKRRHQGQLSATTFHQKITIPLVLLLVAPIITI